MMNTTLRALPLLLISGLMFLLSWYGLTVGHNWDGDFSQYIMQAKSILEGVPSEFAQANRFSMEESSYPVGPVAYPWGYPMLLLPFYAVFGLNWLALKSLNIIFYFFFTLSLWLCFRRYHGYFWRVIFVCLFAFNPFLLKFLNYIMSDVAFLFLSTSSVLLMGQLLVHDDRSSPTIYKQILLGAMIAISFFIRTQGLLILATLAATQCIDLLKHMIRQQKASRCEGGKITIDLSGKLNRILSGSWHLLFPYLSFFVINLVWRSFLPEGGSSHLAHLESLSIWAIKSNISYYLLLPADFFYGLKYTYLIYFISIPFALFGIVKRWRSDYHILIYGILTIALLVIWPSRQGLRFLFPLLPFYFSFVLTGIQYSLGNIKYPWHAVGKVTVMCSLVVLVGFFIKSSSLNALENISNCRAERLGPHLPAARKVFSYISEETSPDSVIVFWKPRVMKMFTDRQSIMLYEKDKLSKGDYLCIYSGASYHQFKQQKIVSLQSENRLRLVYQNEEFKLFKIDYTGPSHGM